jgi:hypothetical protein
VDLVAAVISLVYLTSRPGATRFAAEVERASELDDDLVAPRQDDAVH